MLLGIHKPTNKKAEIKISAREFNGLMVVKYVYSPGEVEPWLHHAHREYHLTISQHADSEYLYRGGRFQVPTLTLSIIHWGVRYAPVKFSSDETETFVAMHIAPGNLSDAAKEIGWQRNELPNFKVVFLPIKP